MTDPPGRIYVDVDDVLSETAAALLAIADERFGVRLGFDDLTDFDLETTLGFDPASFRRFVDAAHEPEVLLGMTVVPGAAETIAGWRERGYVVEVITGRPPSTAEPTLRWLERAGVSHDRFACVDKYGRHHGHAGRVPLEDLAGVPFRLAVEDAPQMAAYLATHTAATVALLDRPWNRHLPPLDPEAAARVVRVTHWADIRSRFPTP